MSERVTQRLRGERVVLGHGGGGQLTDELLRAEVMPRLSNEVLGELLDSGIVEMEGPLRQAQGAAQGRLALTIDGYVVQPLRFPGGDIGRLAVSGTVNDLAVCGAEVRGLALGLILEEGLERAVLAEVMESVRATAEEAGVKVITGDTKVVGRGQADGMYITTAGVGVIPAPLSERYPQITPISRIAPPPPTAGGGRATPPSPRRLHPDQVRPGDMVILNGSIADHGLTVMLAREMPNVKSVLRSDAAPLNRMIAAVLAAGGEGVAFMRDATRGGLAGLAADLAARTGYHVTLEEEAIPVRPETRHAAEMLGLDPLEVANEGKIVIVARPAQAEVVLAALRADAHGREGRVIGRVEETRDGICEIRTTIGGRRILQKPYGELLPRIC